MEMKNNFTMYELLVRANEVMEEILGKAFHEFVDINELDDASEDELKEKSMALITACFVADIVKVNFETKTPEQLHEQITESLSKIDRIMSDSLLVGYKDGEFFCPHCGEKIEDFNSKVCSSCEGELEYPF